MWQQPARSASPHRDRFAAGKSQSLVTDQSGAGALQLQLVATGWRPIATVSWLNPGKPSHCGSVCHFRRENYAAAATTTLRQRRDPGPGRKTELRQGDDQPRVIAGDGRGLRAPRRRCIRPLRLHHRVRLGKVIPLPQPVTGERAGL